MSPRGEECSERTLRRRVKEVSQYREALSGANPTSLLQAEIGRLSRHQRQSLLTEAGITLFIPPEQGLAIKADLALPWHKMREIRR